MASKKQSPMDFIVAQLKKNKDVAYADVKKAADKRGLSVYPIMYGRAKAMLGLVPVAPRGTGQYAKKKRAARSSSTTSGAPARRRGRPPKSAASKAAIGSLDDLVSHIRDSERERDRMARALDQIRKILAEV